MYCGKQNNCVPDTRITLANKNFRNHAWKIRRGLSKPWKRLLSRKKNLEGILICVCADAANKSCRWQAQSLQQYNTGRSRCKAVIIFRAPHTEGKMLLSLSGHASEMASASTLSVFMLSTRHAYKGTNISQLAARVFGSLPQNRLTKRTLYFVVF